MKPRGLKRSVDEVSPNEKLRGDPFRDGEDCQRKKIRRLEGRKVAQKNTVKFVEKTELPKSGKKP